MDGNAEEAFGDIAEGGEVVHPGAPECRNSCKGDDNCRTRSAEAQRSTPGKAEEGEKLTTTERDHKQEKRRHQQARQILVGREGRNSLPKTHIIDFEKHKHHPRIPSIKPTPPPPNRAPPPAHQINRTRQHRVRQLHQNRPRRKRDPRINLAVRLPGLVNIPEIQKLRLQLLDQRRRNRQRHEDGEQPRLEIELRLPHAVEGEHVEKARDDVQGELPDHVVWRAPIRCEAAFDNRVDLGSDGHSVLAIIVRLASRGRVSAFLDHILDFPGTVLVFAGVGPDVAPVLAFVVRVASADGFEHVLCWVRAGRAFPGTVGFEIVD